MFSRTNEFCLRYALFSVCVGEVFSIQSTQNGNNIRSDQQSTPHFFSNNLSEQIGSSKSKPLKLFDCLGLDICQVGIHFCNERKKVCEKCADYHPACGTKHQQMNCTPYCMDYLVKIKCSEVVTSIPSILPTTTKATETSKLDTFAEKPESGHDSKWIVIVVLVLVVVPSLLGNVVSLYHYFSGCGRQSTQMEYNESEQKLLQKDCPGLSTVETSSSFNFMSNEYASDPPKDDNSAHCSEEISASFISPENSDRNQTSVKSKVKHLPRRENQGREHNADYKDVIKMKVITDVPGQEADTDKQSSSSYSSASSIPSFSRSCAINNNIHIKIINGQSEQSAAVMETEKAAAQPENACNQAPYGVMEVGTADYAILLQLIQDDQMVVLKPSSFKQGVKCHTHCSAHGCRFEFKAQDLKWTEHTWKPMLTAQITSTCNANLVQVYE